METWPRAVDRTRFRGCRFAPRPYAPLSPAALVVRWAVVAIALLAIRADPKSAHADAPPPSPQAVFIPPSVTNRAICIDAGAQGPCFSLDDLQAYSPPPPKPKAWKIKPVVWQEYPPVLAGVPSPERRYAPETIEYLAQHEIRDGDPQLSHVALTFDCEAGPGSTRLILETLRAEDVHATFFLLGKYVYRNPELIQDMVAGGHELGNHSFFHPLFNDLDPVTATLEITYTEAAVAWSAGEYVPMRYFRFPYGGRNWATRRLAASLGYQSAFWDLDPRGWEPDTTAQDVVAHVQQVVRSGSVIIMHCGCWDDAHALPGVIQAIRDKGLTPGTLSDVLTAQDRDVPGYGQNPP
jgi:peptidoglycan/xylan/chitin deacetylase (PgdA/CDA1 family)